MGVMHHGNHVKLLEMARVLWMDEHDIPYREWVAQDRHFAVTRVDVRYRRAVQFDDPVEVAVWVDSVLEDRFLTMTYSADFRWQMHGVPLQCAL